MPYLYLVRHPRTHVDPSRNPHDWGLSEQGQIQVNALLDATFWQGVSAVYASTQNKASEPARVIGTRYKIPVTALAALSEVQRGTENFISASEFDQQLSRFFSSPNVSVAGWERATDALHRFDSTVENIRLSHKGKSFAVISHGTILSLYYSKLMGKSPMIDVWRTIGFAAVATVDLTTNQLIHPFVETPYTMVPVDRK
jgi:broad specificity phosphatase PhoE